MHYYWHGNKVKKYAMIACSTLTCILIFTKKWACPLYPLLSWIGCRLQKLQDVLIWLFSFLLYHIDHIHYQGFVWDNLTLQVLFLLSYQAQTTTSMTMSVTSSIASILFFFKLLSLESGQCRCLFCVSVETE